MMLCDSCRDEVRRWEQLTPSQLTGVRLISNSQNYMTVMSAYRGRIDDYYELVNRQESLIRARCEREGHLDD